MAPSHGTPTRSPSANPSTPGPDRCDTADDLMTRHDRQFWIQQFAVHHMQIGPADAAGFDLDQNLAGSPAAVPAARACTSAVCGRSSSIARIIAILICPLRRGELFIHRQSFYINSMRTEEPRPIRLKDYRPPDWLIETVDLDVSLDPTATTVRATLKIKPNGASHAGAAGARRRRPQARGRSRSTASRCRQRVSSPRRTG